MSKTKARRRGTKPSRAELAGQAMGYAIVEMAQLMYQNNTKRNFLIGVIDVLKAAISG